MVGFVYAPLKPDRPTRRPPGRADDKAAPPSRKVSGRSETVGDGKDSALRGLPISTRSLVGHGEIDALLALARTRATQVARDMLSGNTSAAPHAEAKPTPCDHCGFISACRIAR